MYHQNQFFLKFQDTSTKQPKSLFIKPCFHLLFFHNYPRDVDDRWFKKFPKTGLLDRNVQFSTIFLFHRGNGQKKHQLSLGPFPCFLTYALRYIFLSSTPWTKCEEEFSCHWPLERLQYQNLRPLVIDFKINEFVRDISLTANWRPVIHSFRQL